jgi:exonuclease SbcC
VEETFLQNQAGILASTLQDGKPCPVCGAVSHPSPAKLTSTDISEEKLKSLKDASEKARQQREAQSARCGGLKAEAAAMRKRFLTDISEFLPDVNRETLEKDLTALLNATREAVRKLTREKEADEKALAALIKNREASVKRKSATESALESVKTLITERSGNQLKAQAQYDEAAASFSTALTAHGFADETAFKAALITEAELNAGNRQILDYEKAGDQLTRDITRLESETAGKDKPDLTKLTGQIAAVNSQTKALSERRDEIKTRLNKTSEALKELRLKEIEFEKVEKTYAAVKQLSDTANGKLEFETYAQMVYFERVLRAANLRLKIMSQGRYSLLRKTESTDSRKRFGLDTEVFDAYTGKARPSGSLSGGESFLASLALALGLSDIVQQNAGGVHLDAMFIDEGFGSLDTEVLELAVHTLSDMAGTGRSIGIISHVAELRQQILKQIQVEKTPRGSRVRVSV